MFEATNVLDFTVDRLQTMRVKRADGIIDPNRAKNFRAFFVESGGSIGGDFGRVFEAEACDVENPDAPLLTTFK